MKNKKIPVLEPIGTKVVIRALPKVETTPGGIVLPDSATETVCRGFVVAVGPGDGERKMQVAVGDEVLYSPYAQTVKIDEDELVIAQVNDILAILR